MRFDVLSIFPEMLDALTQFGITRKAVEQKKCEIHGWQLRDFASNAHRTVDDRPYGGGPGMLMMPDPIDKALLAIREAHAAVGLVDAPIFYLSPQGKPLNHARVMQLKDLPAMTLLAGRYEGVDERVLIKYQIQEISVGDFVLSGGELPAMIVMDAIIRQLPDVLGDVASAQEDSFVDGLLDCPHYTRPEVFADMTVPEVLMSGHHERIKRWRLQQSLGRTALRRPDLLQHRPLSKEESRLLADFRREQEQDSRQLNRLI